MKSAIWSATVGVCLAAAVFCMAETTDQPTAHQLLKDVIAQLPSEPLSITGDMIVRKQHGVILRELKFEMNLNLSSNPPAATYIIADNFGRPLEQLTVKRPAGGHPVFTYAAGAGATTNLPNIFEEIQGTDISWADLTLSFLWWPGGKVVMTDSVKSFDCYVVDVACPPGEQKGKAVGSGGRILAPYVKSRLWIEKKYHVLMQAEGYDAADKLVRKMSVKSFKKINNRWMIKDMEIESPSEVHRTKIIIREAVGAEDYAREDKSGETTILQPEEVSEPAGKK